MTRLEKRSPLTNSRDEAALKRFCVVRVTAEQTAAELRRHRRLAFGTSLRRRRHAAVGLTVPQIHFNDRFPQLILGDPNERGLRRVLAAYVEFYLNRARIYRSTKIRPFPGRSGRRPMARSWQSRTLVACTTNTNVAPRSPRSIPFPVDELRSTTHQPKCVRSSWRAVPTCVVREPLGDLPRRGSQLKSIRSRQAGCESSDEVFSSHR